MNKLVAGDIEVSKKQFYESKKDIKLSEVDVNKIAASNKVKGNNETSKIFIGYLNGTDIVPLCIVLPQMSGWIKYFQNGGKNMSFKTEDNEVYLKYSEIWGKNKELLYDVKLGSDPIYDGSYIKTKVKTLVK